MRADDIALDACEAPLGEAPLEQFEASAYARQKIVEVVGDPACQLTNGLHFLRLAQRLLGLGEIGFGRLFLGDIAAAAIHHPLFRNADPGDPAVGAILAAVAIGKADRRLALLRQFKSGARPLDVVRMQHFENRHAGNLFLRPSQHRLPGRIGGLEIALRVECAEEVRAHLPGPAARLGALDNLALQIRIQFAKTSFAGAQRRRSSMGSVTS